MVSNTNLFLTDLVLTAIFSSGVVIYLKRHLRPLVVELCGTPQRAQFWIAFADVTLLLVPIIFALSAKPDVGADKIPIYEMADQCKVALIGLMLSLVGLAVILLGFIRRVPNTVQAAGAGK